MITGLHAKGSSYGLMMYNFTKTLDGINNTLCDRALKVALRLEPSLSLNEGISLPDPVSYTHLTLLTIYSV